MREQPVHLFLSALAYGAFVAVVAWAVAFLSGAVVPQTVDAPVRLPTGPAVATDVALLLLFAVQHSVMARRPVKRALERWVPPALERTAFVLATAACLAAVLALWQPVAGWVWHVDGPWALVLWSGFVAGWVLALGSTFLVDHLEFTGLRQTGWADPPRAPSSTLLVQAGLYGIVRHPMMVGLLVAFWCTPRMSVGHLLFATAATGYIAVGVRFEERDLRRDLGPAYGRYAERVPSLVPGWRPRRRGGESTSGPRTVHTVSKDSGSSRATVDASLETRRHP
ncbi:MAG TPA: isoprenylcysteine carboxylmethyltransferase family protein [Ornithinibacter sp.]|nr:isoprenylcysteine carboxylmethyltransferase family protein [Ornithinibacter sp.]